LCRGGVVVVMLATKAPKRPLSNPSQRTPTDEEVLELERLVRLAVRAFFEAIDIVIVDTLVRHRAKMKDEAIAQLLNLPSKDVKASLNNLRSNMVVASETRNEKDQIITPQEETFYEPGQRKSRKSISHNLWYIDYPKFLDMLRFRLWKVSTNTHQDDKVFYKCTNPSCGRVYDAIKGPQYAFKCRDRCDSDLEKVIQSSTQGANLGTLNILMDQLKKCDDLPFPQFEKWITEVETDYEHRKAKPQRSHHGHKYGKDIVVKIEVDLNDLVHPSTSSIFPQEREEATNKGPPPWMSKPIDAIAANSGQLIIRVPPRTEKKAQNVVASSALSFSVPHWPSEPNYKYFFEKQSLCVLKKEPTKAKKEVQM